jgi:hypothetical protein
MTDKTIPTKGILKRSVNTTVKCSQEDAFALISSSDELHLWLKKCGAVPGAKSVEII